MADDRKIRWLGSSYDDLTAFPKDARRDVGYQLGLVQLGVEPRDWKPFETVGAGVKEIRVHMGGNQYRSLYLAKFEDTVYVLHCFVKKEQKTSKHDIEIARARYRAAIASRKMK